MVKEIDISSIPESIKDKIVKDYLIKYYHWTIGTTFLIIGFLLGLLAG